MAFVEEREAYMATMRRFLNELDGDPAPNMASRPA